MAEMDQHLEDLVGKILPILRPYVRRISLFGSVARREEGPLSDVDLLVTLRPPGERPRLGLCWFELEHELSLIVGQKVEMVTEAALSPHVRPSVERDAVLLYEDE